MDNDVDRATFYSHDYTFVDIFVEHKPTIHAAFTYNPGKHSKPYSPSESILEDITTYENYMHNIMDEKSIFDHYHHARRELRMKPYCEQVDDNIAIEVKILFSMLFLPIPKIILSSSTLELQSRSLTIVVLRMM